MTKPVGRREAIKYALIAGLFALLASFLNFFGGRDFNSTFSKGGTMLSPIAKNIIVWRAPFAGTVTNVRGYRVGGTGATINARKNGASNHLGTALSLTSADTWMDGGSVQNAAYDSGDKLEIMIVTVTGTPDQVAVQVDFTKP